tara:strand:+ start:337 stop:1200 length:864 start_codon:yes stop_codon:yes gene_type:complete
VLLENSKTISGHKLSMLTMEMKDVPSLHELSICVNWPHRAQDWRFLQGLGEGLVLKGPIEQTFGSAMWFPISEKLTCIGMLITSPRLQHNGAGMWLMQEVLRQTSDSGIILNATKEAYPLYLSLGFQSTKRVYQHNGVVRTLPDGPDLARNYHSDDFDKIVELDRIAYGENRKQIFEKLLKVSEITILERGSSLVGFAMSRKFGKGHVIGPVVAENEEDVLSLIRPLVGTLQGEFVRMDTRADEGPLRNFLGEAGIILYDQMTTMTHGDVPQNGLLTTYGLVNQAFG